MEFNNTENLINKVNDALGEFCNEFGRARKELAGLGKLPKRGVLFTYDPAKEKNWAINEGGGTEVQYHIVFDADSLEVRYGLGFNTQYVPFANEMGTVEYMKPFMDAFIKYEDKIKTMLPDYYFVYGTIDNLRNPKHDQYTLLGKVFSVEKSQDFYIIEDSVFKTIIQDLKKQFEAFKIIFKEKGNLKKTTMSIQNKIEILKEKGQIILQGPPGTGKTFTAKDMAEQMLFSKISEDKKQQKDNLERSGQFKIIQFHPAYSYEDFVRGIVAESNDNQINYITKNKIFSNFAQKAYQNWLDHTKSPELISKEVYFKRLLNDYLQSADSIIAEKGEYILNGTESYIRKILKDRLYYYNKGYAPHSFGFEILFSDFLFIFLNLPFDADYSKVTLPNRHYRKLLVPLLQDFRSFVKVIPDNFNDQPPQNKLLDYVLVIDEINRANLPSVLGELIYSLEYRDEIVESMYPIDDDNHLIIPSNLYIIGTMNTSDRSVGHIDYAIRRRFAFIDILPQILEGNTFELELFKKVSGLFVQNFEEYTHNNQVSLKVSEHLSEEFRPEDVWLGHSYFINKGKDFEIRKKYEIIPILKEYIKDGILKESAELIISTL